MTYQYDRSKLAFGDSLWKDIQDAFGRFTSRLAREILSDLPDWGMVEAGGSGAMNQMKSRIELVGIDGPYLGSNLVFLLGIGNDLMVSGSIAFRKDPDVTMPTSRTDFEFDSFTSTSNAARTLITKVKRELLR